MRLFIAIDPSKEVENYLLEIQKSLQVDYAKINLTKSFHLTLKFLGEVSEDNIPEINDKLSKIKFKKFSLTLDKLGVFPNENYINVVWVGFKEHEPVNSLQKEVENALIDIFPRDRFHPHITLARVKFVSDKEKFVSLVKGLKVNELSFSADSFRLYQSVLKREGPEYRVVENYSLG